MTFSKITYETNSSEERSDQLFSITFNRTSKVDDMTEDHMQMNNSNNDFVHVSQNSHNHD
jgi:hypothetical protein